MLRPADIPYGRGMLRPAENFLSVVYCNKPRPNLIFPAPKLERDAFQCVPPYLSSLTMHVGAWSRCRCGRLGRRARDAHVVGLVTEHQDPAVAQADNRVGVAGVH